MGGGESIFKIKENKKKIVTKGTSSFLSAPVDKHDDSYTCRQHERGKKREKEQR